MLNPTQVLVEAFGREVENAYAAMFGSRDDSVSKRIAMGGRLALECIAGSDAAYHDVQHTMLVTLVGLEILRGRQLRRRVSPDDWVHFVVALLCHDIGYVRGICRGDTRTSLVVDADDNRVTPPRGATDAFLAPYHVERGKLFVRERLSAIDIVDVDRIARAIELTRFPVPDDADHKETDTEAGLVRAADLIGQLADPLYVQKLSRLYAEFRETGTDRRLGYESAADLAEAYPSFYWSCVRPYIEDAIGYLQMTQEGKQWLAMLHSHVFAAEHRSNDFGPFTGPGAGGWR
jgi:hypothetical protein